MSGRFRTTVEEMQAYGARIDQVNRDIQGELARIRTVVGALEGTWRGEARAAYAMLQRRWDEDAAVLNTVLAEIRQAVEATTGAYGRVEHEQAAAMNRITSVLG